MISAKLQSSIDEELASGTSKEELLNVLEWRAMSRAGQQVIAEVKQYLSSLS